MERFRRIIAHAPRPQGSHGTRPAAQTKRYAETGLDVYINEMDPPIEKSVTQAALASQAATYGQMMSVCLAGRQLGLIVFGIADTVWAEPPFLVR